jgi:hypothetical protein
MKGTLSKTQQGWVVKYDQRTWQDPSAEDGEYPLHPEYVKCYFLDEDAEGSQVEFEIVTSDNGAMSFTETFESRQYAKLIRQNWNS